MLEDRIEKCGFVVQPSRRGAYFDLTFWVRFEGHIGMRDVHYTNLSTAEMIDTILANVADYEPGSIRMDGGHQYSLFGPEGDTGDEAS